MNTMKHVVVAALVAAGSLTATAAANAQATKPATHAKKMASTTHIRGDAKLKAEAKVKEGDAMATAMKEVPNGKIESGEIERENGKLIYSFDMKVPGKSGGEEVNVGAMTGGVVAHEHETAKAEKAEKAEAKMEAKEHKTMEHKTMKP